MQAEICFLSITANYGKNEFTIIIESMENQLKMSWKGTWGAFKFLLSISVPSCSPIHKTYISFNFCLFNLEYRK